MTHFTEDYLVWHHFGKKSTDENKDLVASYRKSLETSFNPFNLGLFVESFSKRTEINMARPTPGKISNIPSLKCQVQMIKELQNDYPCHRYVMYTKWCSQLLLKSEIEVVIAITAHYLEVIPSLRCQVQLIKKLQNGYRCHRYLIYIINGAASYSSIQKLKP